MLKTVRFSLILSHCEQGNCSYEHSKTDIVDEEYGIIPISHVIYEQLKSTVSFSGTKDYVRIKNVYVTFSANSGASFRSVCSAYRQKLSMSLTISDMVCVPSAKADDVLLFGVRMVDVKQRIVEIGGSNRYTTGNCPVVPHCGSRTGRYSARCSSPATHGFYEDISCGDMFESVVPGTAVVNVNIDIPADDPAGFLPLNLLVGFQVMKPFSVASLGLRAFLKVEFY
jgi:hypothetical protein